MEEKISPASRVMHNLVPILSTVLVCLYPCLFQWFQNADEALPEDMLGVLAVFLLVAAVVYAIAALSLRSLRNGGLFTSVFMFCFCNIGLLSSALKGQFSWMRDRYLLILFLLLAVLFWIFLRKHQKFPGFELCTLIAIAMGVLSLMSFFRAAPVFYEIATTERKESTVSADTVFATEEKPNVYYFIMDEYGGSENLKRYYEFDNEEFLTGLEEKGFAVSRTSHNSESVFTWTLVPNLLNLDYVVEDELHHLVKKDYVEDPVLNRMFRNNGYRVNLINHRDFLGSKGCNVLTKPQLSDSIGDHLFGNSFLNLIPRGRVWLKEKLKLSSDVYYVTELDGVMDLVKTCGDYTQGPTLTMIYLQSPHLPFVKDAEGNGRFTGTNNVFEKYYYLDQLKWLNTVLDEAVENMIAADPDAIIILQSDHGSRFPAQTAGMFGFPELDQEAENTFMQNILCCVYFGGKPIEIEGLSGINTLRHVLNSRFGTEIEMLEEPVGYIATSTDWK